MSKLKIFKSETGLTLIEVMVVVAILAVISSTLFSLFNTSLFSQRRGTNKALVYSEARAALDMMSKEMEKAFADEREGIGFEIWNGDSGYRTNSIEDEFYFVAPINPNNGNTGTYKGDLSEVGYWLNGFSGDDEADTLMRHYTSSTTDFGFDTGNSTALIGNVSDLQFQYWDNIGNQFVDATGLPNPPGFYGSNTFLPRTIKITLVMQYEMEKDNIEYDTFIAVVNIPGSGQ